MISSDGHQECLMWRYKIAFITSKEKENKQELWAIQKLTKVDPLAIFLSQRDNFLIIYILNYYTDSIDFWKTCFLFPSYECIIIHKCPFY